MSESSLTKLQALRTVTLLKRDSNTGFLLWILWIIQEHLFCRWLWRAGTETPVRLFKNTFFTRPSPVAASDDEDDFSEYTRSLFPKRLWKCASTVSSRKYKWKVVIYLFNYDSSKSFFFMLNKAFDVLLSTVSCNTKITRTSCSVFWYVLFYKNLILLHHGNNNFLFYLDICIKFTLSTIISTRKKW